MTPGGGDGPWDNESPSRPDAEPAPPPPQTAEPQPGWPHSVGPPNPGQQPGWPQPGWPQPGWSEPRLQPPPGWQGLPPGWKPPKGWALGLPPAGPGSLAHPARRLAARVIDGLLWVAVLAVLATVVVLIAAPHIGPLFPGDPYCAPATPVEECPTNVQFPGFLWIELIFVGAALVTAGLSVVGDAFITARWGRTPGKALLKIRPVRAGTRVRLGFWRALGRAAATTAASSMSWIGLIDPLWCVWDDNTQCLHDKLADTIVISDE